MAPSVKELRQTARSHLETPSANPYKLKQILSDTKGHKEKLSGYERGLIEIRLWDALNKGKKHEEKLKELVKEYPDEWMPRFLLLQLHVRNEKTILAKKMCRRLKDNDDIPEPFSFIIKEHEHALNKRFETAKKMVNRVLPMLEGADKTKALARKLDYVEQLKDVSGTKHLLEQLASHDALTRKRIDRIMNLLVDVKGEESVKPALLDAFKQVPDNRILLSSLSDYLFYSDEPHNVNAFFTDNMEQIKQTSPKIWAKYEFKYSKKPLNNRDTLESNDARQLKTLLEQNAYNEAKELLLTKPDDDVRKAKLALIDQIPNDEELQRPLVIDDGSTSILTEKGENGLVIAFAGLDNDVVFPIRVIDRFFAKLGLQAWYLRDETKDYYVRGIPALGTNLESTIKNMNTKIDSLAPKTLFTIGFSLGASTAIRYGVPLDAKTILGFSAFIDESWSGDKRGGLNRMLTRKKVGEIGKGGSTVKEIIEDNQQSNIHLFFGEKNKIDSGHAHSVADDELVTLHQLDGFKDHESFTEACHRKGFIQLMTELCEL